MHRVFSITLVLIIGAASLLGGAASVDAGMADICKNGGWQNLVDEDGNPFKNQGACVSHVAQGGQALPPVVSNPACVDGRWLTFFKDEGPGGFQAFSSEADCAAFFASDPCPAPAVMTSPAQGTLPGATVTFTWSAGCGNDKWDLWVGTSPDTGNLFNANDGNFLSVTVSGIPTDGSTIYYRVTSSGGGVAWYEKGSFTAASGQ